MPSVAENQIATTKDLFQGYNEYNADAVLRSRADNCIHVILPTTLNRPSKNNEEYREFFGPLQKIMHKFQVRSVILTWVLDDVLTMDRPPFTRL